jgi:DNA-binding NtrC family response regulator
MISLSSGGLWFLWEEDFKILRPLAQALQPKGEAVISFWYQLYTAHFKPPRAFSEAEFIATFGPHFTGAVAMLMEADRESWAGHTHQLGESLAERGVPFVELVPLFHLFWESVMTVGSEAIDLTFAMQKSFGKLCQVRTIQLTDAYFGSWEAHQGARIAGLEREARQGISTRRRTSFYGLVGASAPMRDLYKRIESASRSRGTILICGESGTGKELIARAIHECSGILKAPFVAVNCAALPRELVESELFGHKRGAFSGASMDSLGLIGAANGGTLFLDEITEMASETQSKLLRVLQDKTFRPVGATSEVAVDVQFLAATNRDPLEAVRSGKLRKDLYYRLQSIVLRVPSLRDRREDIPLLVEHFTNLFNSKSSIVTKRGVEASALEAMRRYSWPGNVRELSNVLESAFTFGGSEWIRLADLDLREISGASSEAESRQTSAPLIPIGKISDLERDFVLRALEATAGNKSRAARILGISRKQLYKKIEDFGLSHTSKDLSKDE